MLKYIAPLLLALVITNVQALEFDDWAIDVNTGSRHSNATYGNHQYYNEDNDGVGLTFGYSPSIDIKLGFFDNSYNRTSVYGGLVFNHDFVIFGDFVISPGVGVLLASGYDHTPVDAPVLAPIVHPSLSFGHRYLRSSIGYIPYEDSTLITFQTQYFFH